MNQSLRKNTPGVYVSEPVACHFLFSLPPGQLYLPSGVNPEHGEETWGISLSSVFISIITEMHRRDIIVNITVALLWDLKRQPESMGQDKSTVMWPSAFLCIALRLLGSLTQNLCFAQAPNTPEVIKVVQLEMSWNSLRLTSYLICTFKTAGGRTLLCTVLGDKDTGKYDCGR